VNAIVAVNADWGIGLGGSQVIVIPEDRRRFRMLTEGGLVIAGRKTYESLDGPLPNRRNIILTRCMDYRIDNAATVHSIDGVLAEIGDFDPDKVFVIGGESVYRQLLPLCTLAYVTKIEASPPSDTFFPDLDVLPGWELESREPGKGYSFCIYRNKILEERHV